MEHCCLKNALKTITPPSHQTIALTNTIDYQTIEFLHYRPNTSNMYPRENK